MKALNVLSAIIMWIGGINYGLVGVAEFNIIGAAFGEMHVLMRMIYLLIGLATVYQIFHCRTCKKCVR